ncbi:hypothetical protein [Tropicibacter naphthalenivorans]|uniref:Uncharacterized protein n=1 Tax=Tropicibacter naphthalenivorans TaxID=441103 RepID=A0A0P1GWM2_9RHOB|nr:hypothetical protein [Tropicibacter naphthalenivorans]CUH80671.1 hypothetical protein TRN7648_03085 [Tropicibacter naphthalenivorans]SMC89260.1 hypothetical protein SAMN04488093_10656 [Tropicibacter naphthalenivorans]
MPWKDFYTTSDEIGIRDAAIQWPEGQSMALGLTVNLNPAGAGKRITAKDLAYPTWHYGLKEGLDRFLELFDQLGIRATEVLTRVTGQAPKGWFALSRPDDRAATGCATDDTVSLLKARGYAYIGNGLADDAPYYWVTDPAKSESLLALPYYYHFDDTFFLMFPREGIGLERPQALLSNWRAEFRAQYRRGRYGRRNRRALASGASRRDDAEPRAKHLARLRRQPELSPWTAKTFWTA